jgi:organic radical activating enzyme
MSTSFLINEIYPCLQGEGINLGKPSLLVRFQICNLRCVWCDTPYTHTFKSDPLNKTEPNGKQKYIRKRNHRWQLVPRQTPRECEVNDD